MIVQDLLSALDRIAPIRYAEPWDNVGLIAGDPGVEVQRALLTIDLTHGVLDEAEKIGAGLVVAYHPPLFEGIKRVRHDGVIHRAIRAGIALWSPHTALDVAPGGTNDVLADAVGIAERAPLRVTVIAEGQGIGRVGALAAPSPRVAVIHRIKRELGLAGLLVAGPLEGDVTRAAVCAGAGRSLLDDVIAKKVDLYVTGELPHHDALKAAAAGVTVACALHSNSERSALSRLRESILKEAPGVAVSISEADRDPFVFR